MKTSKSAPTEALVQSPGDSDGIASAPEADKAAALKKGKHEQFRPMETPNSGETENTADPAKGRDWSDIKKP